MHASMSYRRAGCSVHSATSLGSFKSSRKFLPVVSLYAMYSGRWRPAWRKSHTGVRSTFSPFAARIIVSFAGFAFAEGFVAASAV